MKINVRIHLKKQQLTRNDKTSIYNWSFKLIQTKADIFGSGWEKQTFNLDKWGASQNVKSLKGSRDLYEYSYFSSISEWPIK